MPHQPPQYLQFLPFLIILPVLYFRLRRMAKTQALKLGQLWIRPAIFIVLAALAVLIPDPRAKPLVPMDLTWLLLAAVLGAVAGWHWGRTTELHLHPENGTLMQKGSVAGIMVFLVLLLLRLGLRTGLGLEAEAWHLNMRLVTDASIIFSALLFAVRGLEIFLRARRTMASAG
jgi:Protein of unknown function (DUF1453)